MSLGGFLKGYSGNNCRFLWKLMLFRFFNQTIFRKSKTVDFRLQFRIEAYSSLYALVLFEPKSIPFF